MTACSFFIDSYHFCWLPKQHKVRHTHTHTHILTHSQVRAAEALSKLVSELKESLILNDFSSINDVITQRTTELRQLQRQQKQLLMTMYSAASGNTSNTGIS